MGLPRIAEAALEEVVAPEGDESLLLLRLVSRQRSHNRLRHAVVPYVSRHAAEEVEGLFMAIEEGFLLLIGGSTEERDLGEAQPADKELHGEGTAFHYHLGLTEVGLGILARLVGQGDKDRAWLGAVLLYILPDGGLTTGVVLLFFKPVVYAAGGMMLLGRS
jgi:hypothetical protein